MSNESIKILSYNISHKYIKNNINIYKHNVTKILEESMKYDIIGLQEVHNYEDIIQNSLILSSHVYGVTRQMSYIHSKSQKKNMLTFINVTRFKILAAIPGEIYIGKPFQLIFLQERKTSEYFIIINIHNCKNVDIIRYKKMILCSKKYLMLIFSETIDIALGVIGRNDSMILNNIQNATKKNIQSIIKNKIFNTIVLGDFNDHNNKQEFWKEFKIFEVSMYDNLKNIIVNTIDKPPKTCCFQKNNTLSDLKYINNYISIDTSKLKYIINNAIYTNNIYASDNLPVYAEITLKSNKSSQPIPYRQQYQMHVPPRQQITKQQVIQQQVIQPPRQQQTIQPPRQQQQIIQPSRQQQVIQQSRQQQQVIQPPRQQRVIQPQIQPQTQPPRQSEIYYSQRSVTLRLFNDSSDPNEFPAFNIHGNNNIPINFRGKTIDTNTELIFPNGKKYKGTLNNYTCVMVKNSPYIIGYINCKYIRRIKNTNEFQLFPELDKKILRLIPSDDDPRRNLKIRGLIITKDDILIFPNGHSINSCKIIPDNINPNKRQKTQMILVQDRNNPEKIGYIKYEYLIRN